ncbi:MAG: glycoside hydrolase family 68 protein [Halolamina sp.]
MDDHWEIREATPVWSREQAAGLERTDDVVAPLIYPPEEDVSDDVHVWDTWFLRDRDGSIATVGGYRCILCLTAPSDVLPGTRHDIATVRLFYSADGERWESAGPVFEPDAARGSRQWAGCALRDDDGSVYCYYTAAGEAGEDDLSYTQHIAVAEGGELVATADGVEIRGEWTHRPLLEPDGRRYETEAQSEGMIYTFRDPWFFEDPATGDTHLLFEANVPVADDDDAGAPEHRQFNGSVGIADSPTGDPTAFELRDPLLHATRVNQELERPHVVVRDGGYYLFISSHEHTFAPGVEGFDGLYGFVAGSLHGEYRPLNDTGLVLTNPANAPFQAYSWLVYPHEEELLATSFFNYYDLGGLSLDDVGELPPDEQFRRFGGTLAPTVRVALDGDRTRVRGKLRHGHLPTPDEALPDTLAAAVGSDDGDGEPADGYDPVDDGSESAGD